MLNVFVSACSSSPIDVGVRDVKEKTYIKEWLCEALIWRPALISWLEMITEAFWLWLEGVSMSVMNVSSNWTLLTEFITAS